MSEKNIIGILIVILIIERLLETILPDRAKKRGKVSAKWLFWCFSICYFFICIIAISEFIFIVENINIVISIIGFILIVFRIILKIWAVRSLGRFWSIQIEVRNDQKIVRDGPYRYIRHPSYLSTMIEATAGPLILNAYYTMLFVWFIYFPLLFIRIYLEEKELLRNFGKEYEDYRKEVPLLFPVRLFKK